MGSTTTDDVVSDFTALGDVVNTTARLAGEAGAGELLVSVEAAHVAALDASAFPRRSVAVRGRSEAVDVVVLEPAVDPDAS